MMWRVFAEWQLAELGALARRDPERVETMLNLLWTSYPGLYTELLSASRPEGEPALAAARSGSAGAEVGGRALVETGNGAPARLAGARVAVWEIVREYRKLGSVERLRETFPGLGPAEFGAALDYARRRPEEIETIISQYEENVARRRAEYPYAR